MALISEKVLRARLLKPWLEERCTKNRHCDMVLNRLCWDASYTVWLSKQVGPDWNEFLEVLLRYLCPMWPDLVRKGLLPIPNLPCVCFITSFQAKPFLMKKSKFDLHENEHIVIKGFWPTDFRDVWKRSKTRIPSHDQMSSRTCPVDRSTLHKRSLIMKKGFLSTDA